jgi:YD repeat-containing protein
MSIVLRASFMTMLTMLAMLAAVTTVDLAAHVTIQPREVAAKSSQEFFVRVPTERDQPTTAVRIVFPAGFDLVRVRPTAGWTYELERDAEGRTTAIKWSGGRLSRTEYEVFSFIARPQNPGTFKLDAYQTYGENDVVAWIDAAEPRPAPQVVASAAVSGTAAPSADPFASGSVAADRAGEAGANGSNSTSMVSGAALVISLVALFLSWQTRRPKP